MNCCYLCADLAHGGVFCMEPTCKCHLRARWDVETQEAKNRCETFKTAEDALEDL